MTNSERGATVDNERVVAFMAEYKNRMDVSEHRIRDLEEQTKQILNISVSVEKLAVSMQRMLEEQQAQGKRLKILEDEPAQKWNVATKTAITAIISTVAGALTTAIIAVAYHYL